MSICSIRVGVFMCASEVVCLSPSLISIGPNIIGSFETSEMYAGN